MLVEGTGETLSTMTAYIDVNPVWAGLVGDPKDYRWSGYGEAVAGIKPALKGMDIIGRAMHPDGPGMVRKGTGLRKGTAQGCARVRKGTGCNGVVCSHQKVAYDRRKTATASCQGAS